MGSYGSERGRLNIALVGLGFGAEFVPIYQAHPDVASVSLFDNDPKVLHAAATQFGISKTFDSFEAVLAAEDIDAVHLITPIPLHAKQTVAVLRAGKHCACTVPMATSLTDLKDIIAVQRETGRKYMMMETAVYTREFLMVQDRYRRGHFGEISFARGSHMQDMAEWPQYWMGLPPHHYMTHAIAPILKLLDRGVAKVHCLGTGSLPPAMEANYKNPFPGEVAIFRLVDSPVAVEVTRTLFRTVRPYSEAFSIYGDKLGFEWQQVEDESPLIYTTSRNEDNIRMPEIKGEVVLPPDRGDLLPAEIANFTKSAVHSDGNHLSFVQGSGHGGSHPHLVHEFVRSLVEDRPPAIDAVTAARWTAPGIAAHESAMQDGAAVLVPDFSSL